jgi:2-polyprenyl-6-methoxyphenol hydroxylase-like FAD-dependent oxidoreductase
MSLIPGVGELLAIPMWSFDGQVMALLFESVPGGPQEVLTDQRYEEDPEAYRRLVLEMLERFHPTVFDRVDVDKFRIQRDERDMLQGAVTPVLREDYVRLANGRYLLALGDVHLTVDPVVAQGANAVAQSARVVGDAIIEDDVFDQRFVEKVARRRAERIEAANDWVNTMIQTPPAPQLPALLGAMIENRALANEFTENFNSPVRQLDLLGSEERVAAAIARTSPVPATA